MNVIEGKMTQDGIKVGIVVARFNEYITSKLIGCSMISFSVCAGFPAHSAGFRYV